MSTLTFLPTIPTALWATLAVVALVLWVWYGVGLVTRLPRRRYLAVMGLMALAIALPLLILLNPTWIERIPPPAGKPLLTVLVDTSASMATTDDFNERSNSFSGQPFSKRSGGRSRYQAASQIAASLAAELGGDYEVRIALVCGASRSKQGMTMPIEKPFAAAMSLVDVQELAAQTPDGPSTDLSRAIHEGLHEDRPQGQALLLLSDGIHNGGDGVRAVLEQAARAKAMAAPIYAKTLGGDATVRDLEVRLHTPQELAFVDSVVPVRAMLNHHGLEGRTAKLVLVQDGQPVEDQQREVALVPGEASEVTFELVPKETGLFRYEVQAEPLPGEVTAVNNHATLLVRVVDEPIRVLLLEGKPYWDAKFFIRTLSSDPSVELVSVVQMAQGRLLERTLTRPQPDEPVPAKQPFEAKPAKKQAASDTGQPPSEPTRRVEQWRIRSDPDQILGGEGALQQYQIIVLGRDAELYLTEAALAGLKRWLSRDGGSLVCYRGAPAAQVNQRLGALLPVRWSTARESRFRVKLTDRGLNLRWLPAGGSRDDVLPAMPTLSTVTQTDRVGPLAVVLATASTASGEAGRPVVSYQQYGSGRTVVVEGAGMWRWAFLPPQYQTHEAVYGSLWHSLIRWLVAHAGLLPNQQLALRPDKVSFTTSEPATCTLLTRAALAGDEIPLVQLSGGDLSQPREFKPIPAGDEPGAFRVVFGQLAEGRYQARLMGKYAANPDGMTVFDVRRSMREQVELAAREDLMARIAQESGGAVLSAGDAGEIARQFEAHLARSRPIRVRRTAAWDRWWVLVGVFGLWACAWGLRRSGGLV